MADLACSGQPAAAGNPLRRWSEQHLERAASRVTRAGDDAVQQLEAGVVPDAPWAGRSAALGGVAWTNAVGQLADRTDQVRSDLGGSGWTEPLDRWLPNLMRRLSS